ncbi:30S ribosomal protein S5 [Patescibacteria group bacterium]|nr:30S ribosomal protein S5 [Patescibacteria group bacterium]
MPKAPIEAPEPTAAEATAVEPAVPEKAVEPVTEASVIEAAAAPVKIVDARVGRRFSGRGRGPSGGRFGGGPGGRGRGPNRGRPSDLPELEYEEKNLEISRVTRVTKGGKRMRFRALTVIGNHKGRVGFGVAKAVDVQGATSKATAQARKSLITVPLVNETIPHPIEAKFAAARVLLKPAPKGTGVKAGGAVRVVLALAGVPNVTSKILGSANKINNVKATFKALRMLKAPEKNVESTETV